jgi:hypothetical protein
MLDAYREASPELRAGRFAGRWWERVAAWLSTVAGAA